MPLPALRPCLPAAWLAMLSATAAAAGLGESSGTFACSYKDFTRCTEGSARVTLLEGKVQAVAFDSRFCATKAQPAAQCRLETFRSGTEKWAERGRTLSVTFPHPRYSELIDTFEVSVEDAQIVLDFGDTQPSTKCHPAGDLPERIVITPQAEQCRVEF